MFANKTGVLSLLTRVLQFTKDALASLPQAALLATSSHFTPQPQAALLRSIRKST